MLVLSSHTYSWRSKISILYNEARRISEALEDEIWVDPYARKKCCNYKIQKCGSLSICLMSKKQLEQKWVTRKKKDERGVLDRKKARIECHYYLFKTLHLTWGSIVYQMDVKSAFLYGKIDEEISDDRWERLTVFLGLQVKQKEDGIFISQDKYIVEILKKFDFVNVKTASTPTETQKPLVKDEEASDVDDHLYRSMIGSLMYLTASRPDIMFAVCACSRFQVTPKTSHLHAVKRIFRYLKGKPKLGLWYPRVSSFDLEAYSDSDYAGANLDRKSTTGAKAVSREKEKGVEFKDIEETERPRPTSTRSLLTLKPLLKIDPKDKGKKKIERGRRSESKSDGIPEAEKKFKQLANDEEMARKVQEEWEGEEERKRLAEEEVTNDALIRNYDDIKARIEADRLVLSEKLQNKKRAIYRNFKHSNLKTKKFEEIQALYEKIKRSDEDFIAIGSAEDERLIKEMNEKGIDSSKNESVNEEGKEEEGNLISIINLIREYYSEVTLDDLKLIPMGDLKVMMIVTWRLYESCGVCILEFEDGIVIHMLVEKRYPLSKELLQRMLDLGLEVERESSVALDLIRFIKQQKMRERCCERNCRRV
ncbi:hypothetical protein Tco_1243609 [Tanacetum coccineum]